MFYVYILQSETSFYVGFSADLRRRVSQHNDGSTHSTRGRKWRLVYYEAYLSRGAAIKRERVLKNDGRTRRHLMERIREMLSEEPFNGGERRTGE